MLLVGGWLGLNARRRAPVLAAAIGLLAVGWLLNVATMVPNGGMPVSSVALEKIGAPSDVDVTDGALFKHVPADGDTVLPWLGDVLPVAPLDAVVSVGDLVMAVGGSLLVAAGMAGRRAPQFVTA